MTGRDPLQAPAMVLDRSAPTRLTRFVQALRCAFRADERDNSDRGWTFNLAIFRIVFLGAVVLPFALDTVIWTEHVMPLLPQTAWQPISFYRYLPFALVIDATIAYKLAVANVVLIGLALTG